MTTPEQRKHAARAATHTHHVCGMSWYEAAEAIAAGIIEPRECLDALRALDEAGELEHLFTLVFVGRMKLRPQ